MEDIKLINKYLADNYGKSLDGKPIFRLVWSEDIYEKRLFPEYHKYSPAGIWLGVEYNVVREQKKYDYIKERYILEVYDITQKANPEIRDGDCYECLFVFDKKGKYLKPVLFACEYIIKHFRMALTGELEKRTEKQDAREYEDSLEREANQMVDYLGQESSDLMNKFRFQEAVLIHKGD